MWVASTYICPARGLADLDPPDPVVLGRSAAIAGDLGLDRLIIPVLEESLLRPDRQKVRFLDGLIRCLDRAGDAGLSIWVMAPAQRILGMDWVAPYLVRGSLDPRAAPVFVDGAMRHLRPFRWWADPSIVRKRLACFQEIATAISGHPSLCGWVVMDRALEWSRPGIQAADLLVKSYCAEIRERQNDAMIWLSLGHSGLLTPELTQALIPKVDGLFLRGVEHELDGWRRRYDLAEEMTLTAYLCAMTRWLFKKEVSVEIGWADIAETDLEEAVARASILTQQEAAGATWLHLIDPAGCLLSRPPWNQRPGLGKTGALDQGGEPKGYMEPLIRELRARPAKGANTDVIDMDQEEYLADPETHLRRLWGHFREATG
jgi:hypothetical protein